MHVVKTAEPEQPELKRVLGPGLLLLFIVGDILGTGIYALTGIVALLGGTTSLLLLTAFAVVNVTVPVLRRQPVEHRHFRTPVVLPVIGATTCRYLVFPWTSGRPGRQYGIAVVLLAIGVVL